MLVLVDRIAAVWKRIQALANAWRHYECGSLTAGVAFYGAISIFPLIMVWVAGVGYFFRFIPAGGSARDEVLATISTQLSPEVGEALAKVFEEVQEGALLNGPLAGMAFLFTASLVFAQIDRGFYRIWDVRKSTQYRGLLGSLRLTLSTRARSFTIIVGVCLLMVIIYLITLALRALPELGRWDFLTAASLSPLASLLTGTLVNIGALTVLYRFLSKEKVTWRLSLFGAAIASGLWEAGSRFLMMFSFDGRLSVYGLIGSFLVVLLWIYYTVTVLFLGALIVRLIKRAENLAQMEA